MYETTRCRGTCPVYRIFVTTLTGSFFIGEAHTTVVGERRIAGAGAYDRVEHILRRWRPDGSVRYAPGTANCPGAPADLPGVRVAWSNGSGAVIGSLYFDYGCSGAAPELAAALRSVPALLAVEPLIGAH